MKLIATNREACLLIAAKHNVFVENVEIEGVLPFCAPAPETVKPNLNNLEIAKAFLTLWDEASSKAERDLEYRTGYPNKITLIKAPNKIALIKAVRTLTNAGIKDAKDFVEVELLKEKLPF